MQKWYFMNRIRLFLTIKLIVFFSYNYLLRNGGVHCGWVGSNIYFGTRGYGFDSTGSQLDFLKSGVRCRQVGLKYRTRLTNLVITFVVITKEPFLAPQHVKGPASVVYWVWVYEDIKSKYYMDIFLVTNRMILIV